MLMPLLLITLCALFSSSSAGPNANVIPVSNGQITLQELLAQHGLNSGQVTVLIIAPQNLAGGQRFLGSRSLQGQAANNPIQVESPVTPVNVHYKSHSLPLNVHHTHIPAPKQETQLSRSEEEPHKIVHEVIRPVIQEVREIIQPYRRIIQEIRPVQESVVSQIAAKQTKPSSFGANKPASFSTNKPATFGSTSPKANFTNFSTNFSTRS